VRRAVEKIARAGQLAQELGQESWDKIVRTGSRDRKAETELLEQNSQRRQVG
jgi:hypothetical protein